MLRISCQSFSLISLRPRSLVFSSLPLVWYGHRRHPGEAGLLRASRHHCRRGTGGSRKPQVYSTLPHFKRGLWYVWSHPCSSGDSGVSEAETTVIWMTLHTAKSSKLNRIHHLGFLQVKLVSGMYTWSWGTWPSAVGPATCISSASQRRPCPVSSRWATTRTFPACTRPCVPLVVVLTSLRTSSGRWVCLLSCSSCRCSSSEYSFVQYANLQTLAHLYFIT